MRASLIPKILPYTNYWGYTNGPPLKEDARGGEGLLLRDGRLWSDERHPPLWLFCSVCK